MSWVRACVVTLAACGFPRPADVAEACINSLDCKSPDAPICVDNLCVGACQIDDDCQETPGTPFCQASSGACVACLGDVSCPTEKPVCDIAAGVCRGCAADDECSSGVCLESEGRCPGEAEVVFVLGNSSDVGGCSKTAPCGTLPYALSKVTPSRNVIAITAGQLIPASTIAINRPVYIDANGTVIHMNGVVVSVAPATAVTLANLTLTTDGGSPLVAATVSATGSLRLYRANVSGQVTTNGGAISATKSTFMTPMTLSDDGIACTSGTVAVIESVFHRVRVTGANCQVTIEKSRFDMLNDGSVRVTGGFARIENNLITHSNELADSMYIAGVTPGSTVRFNTFVNTSGVASDGTALQCDGTAIVTSNIFAYGSMHPFTPIDTCPARYSLFDSTALSEQTVGTGNQTADAMLFFVDRARKDFHLGPSSPARGKAEPGLGVSDDIEGHPRPSAADVGAYQAP